MKANAPEKIYRTTFYLDDDKGDTKWKKTPVAGAENIKYTRTDAFIEKACSSIEKLLSGYIIRNFHFGDSYDIDRLIDDFKKYMEGE